MSKRILTIGLLLGAFALVTVAAGLESPAEPVVSVKRIIAPTSRIEFLEPASTLPLFPPTYDTLRWHDYSISQLAHGGPTSGDAWLFGLGVKLTPSEYPAILVGLSHRTYRDPRSPTQGLMQIRITDDDGTDGSPGTVLTKIDTQADTWDWAFHYDILPSPYDTLWDGSFYLFMLSRDTGRVSYTLLWPYDLALNYLDRHWWHQSGQYAVCTNITADLSMGVVVEYPGVGVAERPGGLPRKLQLDLLGPSPFRGVTGIRYSLPAPAYLRLLVYDTSGRLVRTLRAGDARTGNYHADWDGRDSRGAEVPRGLYFCRLTAGDERLTRKLVLVP